MAPPGGTRLWKPRRCSGYAPGASSRVCAGACAVYIYIYIYIYIYAT